MVLVACGSSATPTPAPAPPVEYTVVGSEPYGVGEVGLTFWISVPQSATIADIRSIVLYESERRPSGKIETTFFFYQDRNPFDDQNFTAYEAYEWSEAEGVRRCENAIC